MQIKWPGAKKLLEKIEQVVGNNNPFWNKNISIQMFFACNLVNQESIMLNRR